MPVASPADSAPMQEINMTPLIDVMLVLIVMLIITIPLQSHAVKIDLPPPVPNSDVNPVRNVVGISEAGSLRWNGEVVSRGRLAVLLEHAAMLPSEPEIQLRPEAGAPYGIVDEVLVTARKAQVTRLGFVGNEACAHF